MNKIRFEKENKWYYDMYYIDKYAKKNQKLQLQLMSTNVNKYYKN